MTLTQRTTLLVLAEQPAKWTGRWYALKEGEGEKINLRTSASLVSSGWAKLCYRELPDEYSEALLEITPEGLEAVQKYL